MHELCAYYNEKCAFENIWVLDNGIFVIEDRVIVRPIVFVDEDEGAMAEISVGLPDNDKNEEMIEISVKYDATDYVPIVLFYSHSKCIFVTRKEVFIYDLTQSSSEPLENHDLIYLGGGIDIKRMRLYKYKNFFVLLDKYHVIAVYYNFKDAQYYFIHGMSSSGKLDESNIIGHVLSHNNNNDCIGMIIASKHNEFIAIIYDINKNEISFSNVIKYNYMLICDKNIYSLLSAALKKAISKKRVLHFLGSIKLSNDMINVIQKEGNKYLNVIISKDIRVIRVGNDSYLPLSLSEFYNLKFFNYILTYEQSCLVRIVRDG
jgi:hypothetical protein